MGNMTLESSIRVYLPFVTKIGGFITELPSCENEVIRDIMYDKYVLNFNVREVSNQTPIKKEVVFLRKPSERKEDREKRRINFYQEMDLSLFFLSYEIVDLANGSIRTNDLTKKEDISFISQGSGLTLKSDNPDIFGDRKLFSGEKPEAAFGMLLQENSGYVTDYHEILPELVQSRRNISDLYKALVAKKIELDWK